MIRTVSTNWDGLKMPKRCRKCYLARLDRSIHSLSCQKEGVGGEPTKKKRTQCNFYFLNVDCKRSENACDVNKTGAKCSINFQKQRLWSWAWKTKEQMYMIWNLCLFAFIKVCGRKLQNTATDAHVKRRPSLWPSRAAYQ